MSSTLNVDLLASAIKTKRGSKGLRETAAEIGDVSSATLSRIEQKNLPDVETFIKVCKWLKVSTDTFIIKKKEVRSDLSERDKLVYQLRSSQELDGETIDAMIAMVNVAFKNLKSMPSSFKFKYGFKAKAERLSEQFRKELGISKFDPLDALLLAKHLAIPVATVDDFINDLPHTSLTTLRDTAKFNAMWMMNEDSDKFIIHNNYHSLKRQQSNLMHELSHVILNHEISSDVVQLCFLTGLHYFNVQQEQEAKFLGGCLQIPRPGLLWALKRNLSEEQISDYYNASLEMVMYRLKISGGVNSKKL